MSIPRSKRDEKEIVAFHVGHTRSSNNHDSEFALFQTYSTTFNPSMFANFSGFDFLRAVSIWLWPYGRKPVKVFKTLSDRQSYIRNKFQKTKPCFVTLRTFLSFLFPLSSFRFPFSSFRFPFSSFIAFQDRLTFFTYFLVIDI